MNFRLRGIIFAVMFLALGAAVLAQRGTGERPFGGEGRTRGPEAGPFGGIGNLERLTEALDLNASQVATIENLRDARETEVAAIRNQLAGFRGELDTLIESGDPLAVGNAVLAEHALREQLDAVHQNLMAEFGNVLTPAQRETFEGIQSMLGPRQALLDGPPERGPRGRGGPAGRNARELN